MDYFRSSILQLHSNYNLSPIKVYSTRSPLWCIVYITSFPSYSTTSTTPHSTHTGPPVLRKSNCGPDSGNTAPATSRARRDLGGWRGTRTRPRSRLCLRFGLGPGGGFWRGCVGLITFPRPRRWMPFVAASSRAPSPSSASRHQPPSSATPTAAGSSTHPRAYFSSRPAASGHPRHPDSCPSSARHCVVRVIAPSSL